MSSHISRSDRIVDQLIRASQVPGSMPVVHPEHRVVGEGARIDDHALVPVGPDVLVLARPEALSTN